MLRSQELPKDDKSYQTIPAGRMDRQTNEERAIQPFHWEAEFAKTKCFDFFHGAHQAECIYCLQGFWPYILKVKKLAESIHEPKKIGGKSAEMATTKVC